MKKITLLILSVITLLLLTTNVVFATENSGNSVYASKSIQEKVYQMINDESFDYYVILKSDNVEILKESITPVYTMDLLKYAQTGELDITPAVNGVSPSEQEKKLGNVYIAKTVTDSGEFAGNVEFYIEDGVAYGLLFSPSVALEQYFTKETNRSYMASCSYADHAKRIQNILKKDNIVSISNVKYLSISNIGSCFLVQNGTESVIIPIGYLNTSSSDGTDCILTQTELKQLADENLKEFEEYKIAKEKWEKENPGKLYEMLGMYGTRPIISECSNVDNILNITEFLNLTAHTDADQNNSNNNSDKDDTIDHNPVSNVNSEETTKNIINWIAILSLAIIFVGVFTTIIIKTKRK